MKKKMSRALALMLAMLTLATLITSCSNTPDSAPDGTTEAGVPADNTTASAETERFDDFGRPWVEDDLPEKVNYNRDFTVHSRGNVDKYEWNAESENGDLLNDAIFARNSRVEERLGINLVVIAEGSWSDYASVSLPKIRASIKAGNGTYDLLAGYESVTSLATDGYLLDLSTLDAINFDKPWWSASFNEEMNIRGANYFAVGSLSTSMLYSMDCIFVNTDILHESAGQSYNIYKKVNDREWTFEEMKVRAAEAWVDKNGDLTVNAGDTIGAAFPDNSNSVIGFFYCTGNKLTSRIEEDPSFEGLNIERVSNTIDNLIDLLYKSDGIYPANKTVVNFEDGDTLFFMRWLYWGQTKYAPNMDHYGIVPMPLQDKDQENYVTPVQAGMHMYCIPFDVISSEQNAVITEAFAAESYRSLMPKYFEVVLKTKYAKDAETSQMLDIMYDTVDFDFAYIFRTSINYWNGIQNIVTSQNNTVSSSYSALSKAANINLKKVISALLPK
ncbi:MAG: hypothetical protein MJ137_01470 [Clostridia bacterium]|nr:hypothetical protein [Clostridia bacterium]